MISNGFLIRGVCTRGDDDALEEELDDTEEVPLSSCEGENTDAVYGLNFLMVGLVLSESGMSGQNSKSSSTSNSLDK